jgi:hypothetical protein
MRCWDLRTVSATFALLTFCDIFPREVPLYVEPDLPLEVGERVSSRKTGRTNVSRRITSNLLNLADPRVPHVIAFIGPPVVIENEDAKGKMQGRTLSIGKPMIMKWGSNALVSWAKYDLLSISGVIHYKILAV